MKKTERGSSEVRNAATSPLRSSAGPAVWTNGTPSSAATICASDVLPEARAGRRAGRGRAPRRAPAAACSETDELLAQRLLADELVQAPRAQRDVEVLRAPRRRRGRGRRPGVRMLIGGPRAARGRSGPRARRRARRRAAARPPASAKPRPTSAVAGLQPRVVAAADRDRLVVRARAAPSFSRSSTTIRSAVRLPMPGTACSRAVSPAMTAPVSSRGGPPESTASATFGPTPWTPISARNRSRSSSVAKP